MAHSAIPVVLQGLGPIGQAIGRAVLQKPELQLVAAADPQHAGKNLADLLGPAAPRLTIAADPAQAYAAARGGVVLHATTSLFAKARPQIERAVDAGLSVVSTCEELAYPWLVDHAGADALDARCEKCEVAVVGVGVNPGFVLDRLPALLAQMVGPVRHVRATRVVDLSTRREALGRKMGFGLDEEAAAAALERDELGHVGLHESAALVAAGCGFEIDDFDDDTETRIADEDVGAPMPVRRGQVAGLRQVVRAFSGGVERVRLELLIEAHADEPRDEVIIDADPPIHAIVKGGIAGDVATSWAVVNAAPAIIELRGLVTVLDLPAGR